jgi:hypothetical protein
MIPSKPIDGDSCCTADQVGLQEEKEARGGGSSTSSLCYKLQIKPSPPSLSSCQNVSPSASYPHPSRPSSMGYHANRDMCKALEHTGLVEAIPVGSLLSPAKRDKRVTGMFVCVWGQTKTCTYVSWSALNRTRACVRACILRADPDTYVCVCA